MSEWCRCTCWGPAVPTSVSDSWSVVLFNILKVCIGRAPAQFSFVKPITSSFWPGGERTESWNIHSVLQQVSQNKALNSINMNPPHFLQDSFQMFWSHLHRQCETLKNRPHKPCTSGTQHHPAEPAARRYPARQVKGHGRSSQSTDTYITSILNNYLCQGGHVFTPCPFLFVFVCVSLQDYTKTTRPITMKLGKGWMFMFMFKNQVPVNLIVVVEPWSRNMLNWVPI